MSFVQLGKAAPAVKAEDVKPMVSAAGLELSEPLINDFTTFLSGLESAITSLPDDAPLFPKPDLAKYPRTDIHIPEDSEGGGWATKVTARCTSPRSDLLEGRTVALKDNIAFAGARCTNGTSMVDWTPDYDATVATRIMDAGGVILGKAACENCCLESLSATSVTGQVHNPYAHGYSAGGSSSGCGRLVSIGSVDMAVGCDQGGSIRIPASSCGIVGLKPTNGLVPYTGILGLDPHIDHAGPMARNVRDCALMLEAMAGPDGFDDRQPPFGLEGDKIKFVGIVDAVLVKEPSKMLEGVKIGLLTEGFDIPGQDANVVETVKSAVDKFTTLGATVSPVSIPLHKQAPIVWMCALQRAGIAQGLLGEGNGRNQLYLTDRKVNLGSNGKLTQTQFDTLGPGGKTVYIGHLWIKEKYGPEIQGKCMNLAKAISDAYDEALQEFDVLVMPALPRPPPRLPEPDTTEGPLKFLSRSTRMTSNTCPFNSSGHPALSLPVGFVPAEEDASVKLPTAMQIVGRKYSDVDCLKVAVAWEKASDWKTL